MTINVCPACGYPTLGPNLCAFCRPAGLVGQIGIGGFAGGQVHLGG